MSAPPALARRLGLTDATLIGLGSMIGAGVFAAFTPAAQAAGSGLLVGLAVAALVTTATAPIAKGGQRSALPTGFSRLSTVAPTVLQEMRYHGSHNFMGRPVAGYAAPECWLTRPAATALPSISATPGIASATRRAWRR